MNTFKGQVPLVSATKFNVSPQGIDDGAGAYGAVVNAGSGDWVLGAEIIGVGRSMLVDVNTGALTGTPTGLKVGLYKGDDANGTNGALVTGSDTAWTNPAGDAAYTAEIPVSLVTDPAKFYSLGLSSNGAGTTSVIAGATARFLDPVHAI